MDRTGMRSTLAGKTAELECARRPYACLSVPPHTAGDDRRPLSRWKAAGLRRAGARLTRLCVHAVFAMASTDRIPA